MSLGDDVLGKMCLYLGKGFQNFAELGFRTGLLVQSATRCRALTREQNAVRLDLKSLLWFEAMASA